MGVETSSRFPVPALNVFEPRFASTALISLINRVPALNLIKLKIKASLKQFKTYFDGIADTHKSLLYVNKATTDELAHEMGRTSTGLTAFLFAWSIP